MNYSIYVCPYCRQQLDPEYGSHHEHDDVTYEAVELVVAPGAEWDWASINRARREQEISDGERKRQAAADRAELDAMEEEWRRTAPPAQIQALEASRRRSEHAMANVDAMLREQHRWPFMPQPEESPSSLILLTGGDEDMAALAAEGRRAERARLEEIVRLFEAEGPVRVSFWQLRRTRERLAELD